MKNRVSSFVFVAAAAGFLSGTVQAQSWTPEQQDVWKIEQKQWQMARDKDITWIESMVHPNLSYWETDSAVPQNRDSLTRWTRYQSAGSTTLEHELLPISIVVTGNVAVVNYYYNTASEDYKKERQRVSGHYMDVLIKDNGQWKFLAWAGGDDPKDD
jgi:hypothetical protein